MNKPILNNSFNIVNQYGKHKIPRYIYHITNKSGYNSMLLDNMIKTNSVPYTRGIFMLELTNFFKRWGKSKDWEGLLADKLIAQVAKKEDEIVILRIPTSKLNPNLLKVRSQNILSEYNCKVQQNKFHHFLKHIARKVKFFKKFVDLNGSRILRNISSPQVFSHLIDGVAAKDVHLFMQRKHAMEYFYQDNIPMSYVNKIGEVNLKFLSNCEGYDKNKRIRSIFIELLKETPEVKGAELLKC